MKTQVYCWRLSSMLKARLEQEARSEGKTLTALLEEFALEGLWARCNHANNDAEQSAIRKRAAAAIGSIRGDDPSRSARASELVRDIISRKHLKQSSASHRTG